MAITTTATAATITTLLILLLSSLTPTFSQTVSDCVPSLLTLTPCAPFVQGRTDSPVQSCCDHFKQVYEENVDCLCLLFNDTAINSFPINTTLAIKIPVLCAVHVNSSSCSGMFSAVSPSAGSQISLGSNPNSTVAASPMVTVEPRPNILGLGFHASDGLTFKARVDSSIAVGAAVTVTMLTGLFF